MKHAGIIWACCLAAFLASSALAMGRKGADVARYPLDDLTGIVDASLATLDETVSADGGGSLKIAASDPMVVRLFETGDVDVENARLVYQARIKTLNVAGSVYLEMWCRFPGKGEFFSRALNAPLSGDTDWTLQETPFFLKKGENPDQVRLNIVINGAGTVWIDDVRLLKAPL